MPVNGRHETKTHGPADRLGDLALVDSPQTSLIAVLDASQRRHVLGHDGEILCAGQSRC